MTQAEDLLKLIETVDPVDAAKLDEIDALVAGYLGLEVVRFDDKAEVEPPMYMVMVDNEIDQSVPRYTRSLDALKAIEPERWWFSVRHEGLFCATPKFDCKASSKAKHIYGSLLPNEHLARLHAIVQAIEYDRQEKK